MSKHQFGNSTAHCWLVDGDYGRVDWHCRRVDTPSLMSRWNLSVTWWFWIYNWSTWLVSTLLRWLLEGDCQKVDGHSWRVNNLVIESLKFISDLQFQVFWLINILFSIMAWSTIQAWPSLNEFEPSTIFEMDKNLYFSLRLLVKFIPFSSHKCIISVVGSKAYSKGHYHHLTL